MKKVFPVPPPIIVPDGTELSEIIGPAVLGKLKLGVNDGLSVALGKLPGGMISKIHVHPIVWHFTWVRRGELTVRMKDSSYGTPYSLTVPSQNGVFTEPGTFFQLRNETIEPCEVYYIVGPAFVFEADAAGVKYNDAVVFDHSWEKLAEYNWLPPELPKTREQAALRRKSLKRLSISNLLTTVQPERWSLTNGPGSVSTPSALHHELVARVSAPSIDKPVDPDRTGKPTIDILAVVQGFMAYLEKVIGLDLAAGFKEREVGRMIDLKCQQNPSALAEYELASRLLMLAANHVHPDDLWPLMLFGSHDDLVQEEGGASALLRVRFHVLAELLTFATTVGKGFASAGTMENYRGYQGGVYTDPKSYRHYRPK